MMAQVHRDFQRLDKVETFPWAPVEPMDDGVQAALGGAGQVGPLMDVVARENVRHAVREIRKQSQTLDTLVREGRIAIGGIMYVITAGTIEFLMEYGLEVL